LQPVEASPRLLQAIELVADVDRADIPRVTSTEADVADLAG
jgi:hypothetical protein